MANSALFDCRIHHFLLAKHNRGVSIIYISHRMDEIFAIADRISVLRDGTLVKTSKRGELTTEEVIKLMVGRELKFLKQVDKSKKDNCNKEVVLSVRNLSRKGKFNNISFDLYKGEILGFAGLVGAGRTELMESIFGLIPPDEGEIYLKGNKVTFKSTAEAVKNGIGMIPEDRKVMSCFMEQTIQDNINIVNMHNLTTAFFLNKKMEQNNAQRYIENLRIKTRGLKQKIKYLSGGNQQKAILARWLSVKPEILIMDEPTHGIDVGAKAEIYQLIRELADKGTSILLISSELPELLLLADRIIVMYKGNYKTCMDNIEATEEKIMAYATNQVQ
jgi:ABC-type sugar transport system ATPase subunit